MTAYNMWVDKGVWLKGNIHTHTTNSDGVCTIRQIAARYGQQGYDFVFLTDHDKCTVPEEPTHKPLLIPAVEICTGLKGYGYHFICLGLKKEWKSRFYRSPMQFLDWARQEGVFTIHAHPYWSGFRFYPGIYQRNRAPDGIEIYNTTCDLAIGKGHSLVYWDGLLDDGHRILGFAVDDTHHISDIAGGWIMVKAKARTANAILAALRQGHFYSSQGPEIKSIRIRGRQIEVSCSPVMRINFISNRSKGHCIFASRKLLTFANWSKPKDSRYIRIELIAPSGKTAWSNPIFFLR